MLGDFTQESSYYDLIRFDMMANNDHLLQHDIYQPPMMILQ